MNIHEYQGKSILKGYGVAIQEGIVADTPEGAVEAAKELQKQTGKPTLEDAFLELTGKEIREEAGGAMDRMRVNRKAWNR